MLVFAYGTLVLPIIRDRVLGHPVDTADAVLHGYSKICGWDYLTLVPSDGSVTGVVFEADGEDVSRMDEWEEVPVYSLVPVTVETPSGLIEAHAYDIIADLERIMGRPGNDAAGRDVGQQR